MSQLSQQTESISSIRQTYQRRAARYNFTARLYYLIGFRDIAYRKDAIAALQLQAGDTVVDIGCGTGMNFEYLQRAVGDSGKIIGVDLTDAMLEQARKRIQARHWRNIELQQTDAAEFVFPESTQAVISTFALTLIPQYEQVIATVAHVLPKGGRLVILDLKKPEQRQSWLVRFGAWLTKPFAVSLAMADRKPWWVMQKHFSSVQINERYFGFAYIAVAIK